MYYERLVLRTNDVYYERLTDEQRANTMRFSSSSSISRSRPKRASFFLRFDESSFFFNVVVVSFLLMMGKYPRVVSGLTAIPSASWHDFVEACLSEEGAEGTGECTTWASGNDYGTMPNWDTSLVEDMSGWTGSASQGFGLKSTFNGDISKWDTGKVTNMYAMFWQASAFNRDIGSWNTEKVTTMGSMFESASAFNQDIGSWNTAQVTDMGAMFYYASAFNQNISSWTGTAATTAQGSMFSGATAFQNKFTCTNAITGPASSCVAFTASPPPPTSPLACAFSYKPGESGCNAGNINNGDGMCECCVYTPWSWRSCSNDCGCACDASETYSAGIGKCI